MTKKIHDDLTTRTITVTHAQVSYCIAIIIMGLLFTFIAGYYWGKKSSTENFIEQSDQDALADKMYASMCALYDSGEKEADEQETEDKVVSDASDTAQSTKAESQTRYYAKLIGFGSKNSAHAYVNRLASRGITVNIVERQSKSSRGKIQVWYQVVTPPLPKDALTALVDKLTTSDHLTNVAIIELSSESNERSNS